MTISQRIVLFVVIVFVSTLAASLAMAEPCGNDGRWCGSSIAASEKTASAIPASVKGDPRPGRWCAWWARRHLGISKSAFRPGEYNRAWAFRYIGTKASTPCLGCIVVWRTHVGIIDGECTGKKCYVLSGNDGNAVRRRLRSVAGALFRHPPSALWASAH